MKPVLTAPGTVLLKLRYDEPPSPFPFNFNLRGSIMAFAHAAPAAAAAALFAAFGPEAVKFFALQVGRCRLTL
jgi:hypothetical protein